MVFEKKNVLEMYSAQNIGKVLFTKRFFRALKNKIFKYMTRPLRIFPYINYLIS